jgi:hypothetical protein
MKRFQKINKGVLYALLCVVLFATACSGDGETTSALKEWLALPITDMSIFELILCMGFVGLITK